MEHTRYKETIGSVIYARGARNKQYIYIYSMNINYFVYINNYVTIIFSKMYEICSKNNLIIL